MRTFLQEILVMSENKCLINLLGGIGDTSSHETTYIIIKKVIQ